MMSKTTHLEPASALQGKAKEDHVAGLTRRKVLAGAAAAATTVTIGADTPAIAQNADPNSKPDMDAFVKLSAALTGIAAALLSPDTDSLGMKRVYFDAVNAKQPAQFAAILQIAKAAPFQVPAANALGADSIIKQPDVDALVRSIEANPDTKYLARSIALMWYLGSWYEPQKLKDVLGPNPPPSIDHTVISPKTYTQGWLWRVAQAHPMGSSDMQFGYWTRPPEPIEEFITNRKAKGEGK
jgi:hypothetical protein